VNASQQQLDSEGPLTEAPLTRRARVRPAKAPPDLPRLRYRRGRRFPRAIAWFGLSAFWGHLWHLVASIIATEDIDSRDWMMADDPDELTRRVAAELGQARRAGSLTEAVGGDLWIDFVADTGDCAAVSRAVAEMVFAEYELDDPEATVLPRGHLLLFGGDTAYPVATELEIHNRVTVPWNEALRPQGAADARRVLLGIPGNHDWYAGLDGFGRMFRRRHGSSIDREQIPITTDRTGQIGHFIQWAEAFRVGRFVGKRPALPLEGYTPVQSASYFALRLAPGLDLFGPDRQLRAVDFQQRAYFAGARGEARGIVLCVADPAYAFLEPNDAGQQILGALDIDIANDGPLVLTGDTHHYCRERFGKGMHVIAGGGGAFLHPARILRRGFTPPEAEFPGPRTSLALALQVPWQILLGRSGFLVHIAVALVYGPSFALDTTRSPTYLNAALITAGISSIICFFVGGWRAGKAARIAALAVLTGAILGFIPLAAHYISRLVTSSMLVAEGLEIALAILAGTLTVGAFLMVLTLLGLEQHQALSALAHPGYKHFVRLCVRKDGSRVHGWVLGKVDPLDPRDPIVLVDRFTWENPKGAPRSAPAA